MASSEPLTMTDEDARENRTILARLDAMAQIEADLLAGLERMMAILDEFAERAEPLLTMAEKRAKRGALFGGGK